MYRRARKGAPEVRYGTLCNEYQCFVLRKEPWVSRRYRIGYRGIRRVSTQLIFCPILTAQFTK